MCDRRWLHPFVLVRKYVKPEKIGSIWLNPAWRTDNSRSLWEVVESTPKANASLGYDLEPGWIVVTPQNFGAYLEDRTDAEGRYEVFLIWADAILKCIPWTLDSKEIIMKPGTIWVRPEKPQEGLIVEADAYAARETRGTVVRSALDIIAEGEEVAFTEHAGDEIEVGGERLLVLDEEDILAILEWEASE